MGFNDEYQKLRKKRLEEEQEKKPGGGGMLYQNKTLPKEDVAPIVTATGNKKDVFDDGYQIGDVSKAIIGKATDWGIINEDNAFSDGYQFGDVYKTIGSSYVDFQLSTAEGLGSLVEGVTDLAGYGIAGVSDLLGADEFSEVLKESVKKNTVLGWGDAYREHKNLMGYNIADNTLWGDTVRSFGQGLGYVAGIVGTAGIGGAAGLSSSAITALITGVSGASAMGSGMSEAYEGGATDEEAVLYGAINGVVNAGSELLFGGLGKSVNALGLGRGISSLDDMFAKKLTEKISNNFVKTVLQYGVKASAEGFEEVLAGVGQAVGKKLTYMSDEDLGQLIEDENLLEQFAMGAAISGVMQIPDAAISIKSGNDFITGLSDDEQAVVDNLYNERVAEQEKDGKLTAKEKNKILEQVKRDMERGYISVDEIERVLGGETYEAYQNTLNEEKALQDEYNVLYKMKNGEKSDEQIDRQRELKAKLEEITQKGTTTTLKTQLSEGVIGRVKGTRLAESYNERARRGRAFEADLSKYDDKQAEIVKRAAESGILNNTNRTHEFVDMVAKISADKGVLFDFTNNAKLKESGFAVEGATVNGYFDKKSNTVGVNIDSAKAFDTVVGHEITHVLEGTELYTELQKAVFDYAKTKGEYNGRRQALAKLYAEEDIDSEMTADLIGEYLFTDEDFVKNLSVQNRNVFQKIYDEIKYLYKVVTAGSKEARALEKVKRAFDKAYREGVKANGKASGDVKHSLSDSDGQRLTKEQQEFFKDSKIRNDNGSLKVMHHGTNESFTVFDKNKARYSGTYGKGFYFTDSTSHAATYGELLDVYLNITNPLQNGTSDITKDQIRKFVEAIAEDEDYGIENYGYDATIDSVTDSLHGKSDFGIILDLNITCIGDMVEAVELFNKVNGTNYDGIVAPTETVAFYPEQIKLIDNKAPTANPDIRYSLSDSDGKQLTKGQQEYFKDSKMRDENGNLKVMYHGSQDAGFHVFDPGMSDDDTSLFFVDRNDVAASYSGTSETYEAQSIRTAEDMNKFIESIGVEGYEVIEHDGKFDLIYEDELIASRDTAKEIYEEFCWYESVGEGDANYKVYLNLKNPLVVDGKGRPWNKIDAEFSQEIYDKYQSLTAEEKDALIDLAEWEDFSLFNSEIQEATEGDLASAYAKMGEDCNIYDLFSVAADNFSEESMRENARGYLKTRDYAQRAKEQGYDGVIFNNIVDNGGYSNGSEGASTVAIAFESSQIKSVANENPTGDPDIRFSLSEAVEETNDLMAIHNLTEEKLRKSLKLGGLPMPSVAIARAQDGHNEFGNISLILKKDAIDPGTSRYNKVYSGDAWTPTYPRVEYKVNSKVSKQIGDKIHSLVPSDVINDLGDVHFDTDNMTDTLNRFGGNMADAFGSNYALKYAYLKDSGVDIALPMKEKNISYYGTRENGAIIKVAEALTQEELITALNGGHEVADQYEPIIRKAVAEYTQEKYGDVPELLDIMMPREQLTYSELDGYVSEALSYHRKGVERTVDTKAARELINEQVDQTEYEAWLNVLFSGIVEKEGIRNNADYFTPSGNRRSFEALHYEHNLENVIKAMREKGAKGVGAFSSANILGASTTEFGSIKELKQSTDRLRMMTQDEFDKIRKQYTDRFFDLASSLPKDKNSFIATDDAANMLVEAVTKYKTRSGIANYLRRESQGWANYSEYVVDDLIELVEDIRKMPTGYFEAKPQRAVGFDEVGVFVIPRNADPKLKQELLNRGYSIAEYDPDVDGDRQKVVNSFEQYKFSLSAKGEAPGKGRFYGKDMRLEVAPVAEDVSTTTEQAVPEAVAPVAETVAEPETVAPVADWMPDTDETYAPSLYDLIDERDALQEQLRAAMEANDQEGALPLVQRYQEVTQQISQMEAAESERLASLDEADVPPEMEAPYVAQREPITIDGKSLDKITGDVSDMLGLNAEDRARMAQTIQKYSQNSELTDSDLFDEILDHYEYYEEVQIENDEADAARRFIKGTKLYLPENLKGDFDGKRKDGFNAFRREHFGHFTITTQEGAGARSVDSLYQELNETFPDLFPDDIWNAAEQLQQMADVASMKPKTEYRTGQFDPDTVGEAVEMIRSGVARYAQNEKMRAFNLESARLSRMYGKTIAPVADTPTFETANTSQVMGQQTMFEEPAKKDRFEQMLEREMAALEKEFAQRRSEMEAQLGDKNAYISGRAMDLYYEISNLKKGVRASRELGYLLDHGFAWNTIKSKLLTIKRYPGEVINPDSVEESVIREALSREYEDKVYELSELGLEYQKRVSEIEQSVERARKEAEKAEQLIKRAELHKNIVDRVRSSFAANGFDFDKVLKNARNLSTFATVDNTPQRVMEKALGYKQGQILADETVNKVAQNETEGIKWLNSYTDRKSGLLAQISKQYNIKPGSKESAAAQMYAEGFFVDDNSETIFYGDAELAKDFPDAQTQENIKGLAKDPRIRKIYDETLAMINESRVRNGYPEIQKLDNYFLHFRAMDDTFSRLGLPFNPNDIKAKDLPTDLNGVTADLKPGQPYFASAMHRRGVRTTHDLLGGLERYLTSAKSQIYHIDDIQTLRALRNYIADIYGQANGLESLDALTEEEVEERIKQVYGAHLSTFAKFLNEEANVLAGKTALIDRGLEGIIGRRGMTFIDNLNKQVGSNMVGFNVSSSLTNFLPVVQTFAKTNKFAFVKGFAQTVSNRVSSIAGGGDNFAQNSPVMIRRKGADRFHRTVWQKMGDPGYALMGAVDSISTEIIARAKYNELIGKGLTSAQAHTVTDKWVSRLMGDRSLGQMPQLYNSKMLGLVTKFQLEVRNQLDSQFYDTIQEAKVSNEHIENQLERNAKTAAKVASTFFQLAVAQHIFGAVFESIAGYNPAFDIIDVVIKALGLDDDEESEDTVLDNVEQGFLALLEDLPYTSTLTGGRIPISNALPIEQLINGKDEYGNDKPRWKTALEALPYYVLPGGYGQAKKTVQGLSMFSDKLPVTGSYTDSGNLRFPVEETPGNIAQAAVFGQWANENARYYFDNEIAPLNEKQTQEYADVGMSIRDYWKYRKGLKGLKTLEEKAEYIDGLDLTDEQKNILINNIVDREEDIDMSDYDEYGSFGEFDFAVKNPEKYEFFKANGISYEDYDNADEDGKRAYTWAYENPEKYTVAKAISDDFLTYYKYKGELYDIKADKDENGETIRGSAKEKKIDYINNLDLDYGQRIILFKSMYNADDTYNADIVDYLNGREDISYDEMVTILTELGFTVKGDNVYWD